MVEIAVGGGGELQCPEADVVESLVIDTEGLIGVLNKLVDRERRIVRLMEDSDLIKDCKDLYEASAHLNDSVRDLRTRHNRVRAHHTVRVFFPDL